MEQLCACGCGKPTKMVREKPNAFLRGHALKGKYGPGHHLWKHGRHVSKGYQFVTVRGHERADKAGKVREHVLIAERVLGRPLAKTSPVHHVNENRADNRNGNLVICEDNAYHRLLHRRTTAFKATGNAHALKCSFCSQWGTDGFSKNGKRHVACLSEYGRQRYLTIKTSRL